MTGKHRLLVWVPRILGIVFGFFLGLFALDAFEPGKPFATALIDFAIHLAPAIVVLTVVAVSWRRPWIGGAAFVLLALGYAVIAWTRPDWILAISGPLLIVALLFLWSWQGQRRLGVVR